MRSTSSSPSTSRFPYIDVYHAVAMNNLGCTQILSFDRHSDRIPGVERVEP